eukprot:15467163-Alexandrium_andersonii.AAC.1
MKLLEQSCLWLRGSEVPLVPERGPRHIADGCTPRISPMASAPSRPDPPDWHLRHLASAACRCRRRECARTDTEPH